jgi:hypothetical protein
MRVVESSYKYTGSVFICGLRDEEETTAISQNIFAASNVCDCAILDDDQHHLELQVV